MTTSTEVLMPSMGEGITAATLVKWLKKVGEEVQKNEPLLEVSTDKVDTEIPAPASGFVVELFAKDGDEVAVNAVIATIAAEKGAAGAKASPAKAQGAGTKGVGDVEAPAGTSRADLAAAPAVGTAFAPATLETPRPGATRSSPLVRKMAKAAGVDLTGVAGSGMGGRITKKDLEAHKTAPTKARAPATGGMPTASHGRLETRKDGARELLDGVPVRRETMSKMRSLIAEHMVRSVRTSPHVTTVFEIDMHRVWKYREKVKAKFHEKEGFGLTFTPFFAWAATEAIKRHPIVNVSVDGHDILWKEEINLGIAVALDSGLIVPVIKNAGELNLLGIARRIHDLATRARAKKLSPDEVQGGTFSITNPGMFGSIVSSPIINQPQVAILSIGAVVKRPVVLHDDAIGVRPLVQIGLTFDHRAVDGEGGARYLASLKELLESFEGPVL